jgi:hypothetical protein
MGKFNMRRLCLSVAACAAIGSCGGGGGDFGELGASRLALQASQPGEVTGEPANLLTTDGTLDAYHWPAAAPYTYFVNFANDPLNPPSILQPVKANTTGRLTKVSLNLCVGTTSGSTVIQIRRAAAFLSPVIATAQVPRANSPMWGSAQCPGSNDMLASGLAEVTFDLGGANIGVTAGEEFSITLINADPTVGGDYWFTDFNGDTSRTSGNWLVLGRFQGSQADLFGYRMRFKTYVAPLAAWSFSGLLPPLNPWPAMNRVRAGAVVPVKFSFGADQGLDIFSAAPSTVVANCDGSVPAGPAGESTNSPGQSGLLYDAATQQYTYVWKTQESWTSTCRQLVLRFKDGSTHRGNFQFR